MDIIKGALELRDKQGNFNKHYFETSADMVKLPNDTDTTVADVLNNISVGTVEYADEAGQAEKDSAGNVINTTYAPINSPNFTGVPTAPTAENLDLLTNQVATVAWANNVFKRFTGIVPENMDTLQEFWNALGQDSDLTTTLATELNKKLDSDTSLTSISNLNLSANKTLYTSADNVFSATDCTAFARQLLATTNAKAARKIIGVNADPFFDECGINWRFSGSPCLSETNAKFGKALQLDGASWLGYSYLDLSGSDFAIAGWIFVNASDSKARSAVFALGDSTNALCFQVYRSGGNFWHLYTFSAGSASTSLYSAAATQGQLVHFELDYQKATQTFFLFIDGVKIYEQQDASFDASLMTSIRLGSANIDPSSRAFVGSIDDFIVTKKVLHTADFTPPTAPYEADSDTVALLHFDGGE